MLRVVDLDGSGISLDERDSADQRRDRGAFFTPPYIARYLADWAIGGNRAANVLDPTCGEGVFLLAAGARLKRMGRDTEALDSQIFGVDIFQQSLDRALELLDDEGLDAHLTNSDFFDLQAPGQADSRLPMMDAIVGNPPFVRYQKHAGRARARSRSAALAQGVAMSGLASMWAATLVHACSFLKPNGRIAMVLPNELLTVGYAEPIRKWLRRRFAEVELILLEEHEFDNASERVVLLRAGGSGGCESFSLRYVTKEDNLADESTPLIVTPADDGKWTDLLLSTNQRDIFRASESELFTPLKTYGSSELGSVTGCNSFFTLNDETRARYGLSEEAGQLVRVCPPGTKHLTGLAFTDAIWSELKDSGERVWLLRPDPTDTSAALWRYIDHGLSLGVDEAYKCSIRNPWWRSPAVAAPDMFFTYMSHRYPRLITNSARTTFVNSMHGVRLRSDVPRVSRNALPLLAFNSLTMLGAEIRGRSYGGGILKMEPREAAMLPLPRFDDLEAAWRVLRPERDRITTQLKAGHWTNVVKQVDAVLLRDIAGIDSSSVRQIQESARLLRSRRTGGKSDKLDESLVGVHDNRE